MSGSVELFVAAMTGGVGTGITRSGTALTAKVVAGAGEDVLLVGRGTPSVLKPMADQLGARVIDTSLRGKELYKHIYSEMKADGIIQITDGIPNALIQGTMVSNGKNADRQC